MLKIGIDLGGTNIAAGIVDENGVIRYKRSVPTGAGRPKEAIIDDIAQNCRELCKENGAEVLVAGSAYFKATDRAAFVKTIQA